MEINHDYAGSKHGNGLSWSAYCYATLFIEFGRIKPMAFLVGWGVFWLLGWFLFFTLGVFTHDEDAIASGFLGSIFSLIYLIAVFTGSLFS